uniref:4-galactosyl-N-acetylglucosaminide 3-alpha-L-fucosyltransferase FUT6-like n=1 Tax=Styela clava TaxID=7725 RepID=UPI00193AAC26|nr:4-galactosyl-N-acetylglucosaminide 3-alpha-L-fucosyltransferase FUT6-like [Styela clava]
MDLRDIHQLRKYFGVLLCAAILFILLTNHYYNQDQQRVQVIPNIQNSSETLQQSNSSTTISNLKPKLKFNSLAPTFLSESLKSELDTALRKAQTTKKIILEWYGENPKTIRLQGICGLCEITSNKSLLNDNATKAVVFNYKKIFAHTMPDRRNRRRDQFYVWQTGEAPPALLYLHRRYFQYEEKLGFNLTQSFRRDADIYHPYGSTYLSLWKKKKSEYQKNLNLILENKSRVAVAVISNCHTMPGANVRLQFVRDIKSEGMNLHTLGGCFKFPTFPKLEKKKFADLLKTYKFYFAFENSYHCRDYITEKFFVNGLDASAIPIVWGATKQDYDAIAPPGSYIYADDFSTVKELINYINYLDKNDTAYLEYFKWYQMPLEKLTEYGRQIRYCQLCRILHGINVDDMFNPNYNESTYERPLISDKIYPRSVKSLYNWYYKTEYKDCLKSPSRFYRDNVSLAAKTLAKRT